MSQVTEIAITRALALLKSVNAKYKVILPDGAEHGELEVVMPKVRKRQPGPYGHGTMQTYFSPFVRPLAVGSTAEIPFGAFDGERLRGAVAGWCCYHWGKGSNITVINKDKQVVELLRVL